MKKNTLVLGNNSALKLKAIMHLMMGYNAFSIKPGFRPFQKSVTAMRRFFPEFDKPKPRIIIVLSITPGGNHAWCESDKGRIRKPIWNIPQNLIAEYRRTW